MADREMTLAERCFAYRVANNLTQAEMAKQCGLHWQTIHKCEAGEKLGKMSTAKILIVVKRSK